MGHLAEVKYEWMSFKHKNMTLGIHTQEWEGEDDSGQPIEGHSLTIGLLFLGRVTFEFIYN